MDDHTRACLLALFDEWILGEQRFHDRVSGDLTDWEPTGMLDAPPPRADPVELCRQRPPGEDIPAVRYAPGVQPTVVEFDGLIFRPCPAVPPGTAIVLGSDYAEQLLRAPYGYVVEPAPRYPYDEFIETLRAARRHHVPDDYQPRACVIIDFPPEDPIT